MRRGGVAGAVKDNLKLSDSYFAIHERSVPALDDSAPRHADNMTASKKSGIAWTDSIALYEVNHSLGLVDAGDPAATMSEEVHDGSVACRARTQ